MFKMSKDMDLINRSFEFEKLLIGITQNKLNVHPNET